MAKRLDSLIRNIPAEPPKPVERTAVTGNVSQYQRFETELIHRSDLRGAPYNPRKISKQAKMQLTKSLKEHGLVAPLIWNKRTGNLVSGHQRLSILDALEGTDNYELTVAVIDVNEREEKILNVQVNNNALMGEWDFDKLGDLRINDDISFDEMGFLDADAEMMFGGDERFSEMFSNEEVEHEKEYLDNIKKDRKEMMEKMKEEQSADFYFVVVCTSPEDKAALMNEMGYPAYEEYVYSDAVRRIKDLG